MRKTASAVLAGLAFAGAALTAAGVAQGQTYGYYPGNPYGYGYQPPPPAYDAYGRPLPPAPYGYNGYNGSNGYYARPGDSSLAGVAGAVLGSLMGQNYGYGAGVPYDQYGPDPNGMIGPDGRRIKCKLKRSHDGYYGGYVTRRECKPK
jgi:hypothetical protein